MDVTMVDEVTDNTTMKHLAICTRFINQKGVVQNGFLTDIKLPSATANSITSELTNQGLSIQNMAGFCFRWGCGVSWAK
jgi:hypothetical protein